ncbi:MAG: TRAP transporter substrate-binding protein [Rhodospirillales bacterium]|nr:TRAP transporter substrate-binding protein [Rhodospirillales bacterium]
MVLAASAVAATWDMPTPYGDNNFHTLNIKAFADDVKQRSNGDLIIKVHPGGSLFKHPEIKNAVRSGQVPIGEFLLSRLSNEDAVYEVDSVPFLATSYEQARKLWDASRGPISQLLDKQGLVLLFAVPWPPQGLYANKPIEKVADLTGLKFRAYNPATERLAQLAGAVPTQVEVADLAQAFATGRVESMMTSPSTGANNKAWDYVSHFYNTQAWLPKNAVVVNKKVFEALPQTAQTAILNAAAAAEAKGWESSQAETKAKMAILKEGGMVVSDPSPELAEGLKKIGDTMTKEWAEKAGEMGGEILLDYKK